jgi:hypothetical protein
MLKVVATMAVMYVVAPACGAPPEGNRGAAASGFRPVDGHSEQQVSNNRQTDVSQRFRTLDDYLAHLERQGAVDMPWWREVEPGVYELVTSFRPIDGQAPERATRAELMRRYGFTR